MRRADARHAPAAVVADLKRSPKILYVIYPLPYSSRILLLCTVDGSRLR